MSREYTKWYYEVFYKGKDYIKVGYIHNKTSRYKYDVIRIRMNCDDPIDVEMTIDEAMVIVCGITKVITKFFLGEMPKKLIKFMRIG